MEYQQAMERAREESKGGYVQHVNIRTVTVDGEAVIDGTRRLDYVVGDWFDGAFTVISFEDGREL